MGDLGHLRAVLKSIKIVSSSQVVRVIKGTLVGLWGRDLFHKHQCDPPLISLIYPSLLALLTRSFCQFAGLCLPSLLALAVTDLVVPAEIPSQQQSGNTNQVCLDNTDLPMDVLEGKNRYRRGRKRHRLLPLAARELWGKRNRGDFSAAGCSEQQGSGDKRLLGSTSVRSWKVFGDNGQITDRILLCGKSTPVTTDWHLPKLIQKVKKWEGFSLPFLVTHKREAAA